MSLDTGNDVIKSDTYFYGQSPPVYPTPEMDTNGTWADAYSKAKALVDRMTLAEKANITAGQSDTGCTGAIGGAPRLGFPGLCFQGAIAGMKQQELVNGYSGGLHTGASWNKQMVLERAVRMGKEFKVKGSHLQGSPLIGPLGRLARGGRNNGGFSNDAYLAGQLAALTIQGTNAAGYMATGKHFIGNEQESYRMSPPVTGNDVESVSSNIDDKTMHKLYLWPWADVVRAGLPSVMYSYNRVNNSHACQNSKTLNGLLKGELGFQGWVMTDWGAMNAGYQAALAGLDAVLPDPGEFWGPDGKYLVESVKNGSLPESRLNDMVTRIVTPWYFLGQDTDFPPGGYGTTTNFVEPHRKVYARDPGSKDLMLQNAMEGHVLVKNVNHSLPLKAPQLLSVFGYDAIVPRAMNIPDPGSSSPNNNGWGLGSESTNTTLVSNDMLIYHGYSAAAAYNDTLIHAGGSEASAPAYMSAPFDAIQARAYEDGTSLFWDFDSENPVVNPNSDACLVFINAWSTEGADREALQDKFSDNLVNNVASKCTNTMLFIHNAGIRTVDSWTENPNVTAVRFAHLPGQDSGRSLIPLAYGDVSPSGKLPYAVAKEDDDYSPSEPDLPDDRFKKFPQSNFTEGIHIDYRYFDKQYITPRFEFGFGMSYTTFKYSDLEVLPVPAISNTTIRPRSQPTQPGGNPDLWDVLVKVTATVANTGDFDASEIAQLYVSIPGSDVPIRQLRAFELTRRDLSAWDVVSQDWRLRRGKYTIFVGASSRDLPLNGTFMV